MSLSKQVVVILGLSLLAAVISALVHPKRPAWFVVESPEELRWKIDLEKARQLTSEGEVVWVDARKREKFDAGHMPDAILLNPDEWGELMFENMDRLQAAFGQPVIVYCDGERCAKSNDVAQRLRELLGLEPVYVLDGDWKELLD